MNRIPYSVPCSAYSTCRVNPPNPLYRWSAVCWCGCSGHRALAPAGQPRGLTCCIYIYIYIYIYNINVYIRKCNYRPRTGQRTSNPSRLCTGGVPPVGVAATDTGHWRPLDCCPRSEHFSADWRWTDRVWRYGLGREYGMYPTIYLLRNVYIYTYIYIFKFIYRLIFTSLCRLALDKSRLEIWTRTGIWYSSNYFLM